LTGNYFRGTLAPPKGAQVMEATFRNEKRFCSNFYGMEPGDERLSIILEGMTFPTTEHAYVAAQTTDPELRAVIRDLPTPGKAKKHLKVNGIPRRADWDKIKLAVMEDIVRQKFANPVLAAALIATGDEELVEGNTWGDTFWGVDLTTGVGENHLGRILMKIRNEIR
jgi:N-glycosidase YbiA